MLRKRWYIYPIIGIFIIGFILGSFLDLQINSAIYDHYNWYGLFMAAFGETPVYASFGIIGYGFLYLLKFYKKIAVKSLFIVGIIASAGCSIFFQGHHIFDINAYNDKSMMWLGYLIATFLYCGGFLVGYFILKNTDIEPNKILFILLALLVVEGFAVGVNQLAKILMSRPRYRFLADMNMVEDYYRNWWESGKDIRDSVLGSQTKWPGTDILITKEEFKSFPSGHMTNTFVMLPIFASFPLLNNKLKIKQEVLITIAVCWNIALAYSRMRVGAHFLSDVSAGSLLTLIVFFVVDELYRVLEKRFFPEEKAI